MRDSLSPIARFVWLLVLCAALWHSTVRASEPLHFTSAEILSIDGYGYTPPAYSLNPAELHGEWQTVTLPHALSPQRLTVNRTDDALGQQTVVAWYRFQIPALEPTTQPRYLYIPRWKTDGQIAVYGDSRLLYQSHAVMLWNGWNIPLWIALGETADAVAPRVILVRIESPRGAGGGLSSLWLGEEKTLSWRYQLREVLQVQLPLMSSAAFLAVGVFALFVWFRQRTQSLYLLFFVVSLTSYLRSMHYYLGANRLLISEAWFSWLTVNSLFWMIATVHFFLTYLHRRPSPVALAEPHGGNHHASYQQHHLASFPRLT